MEHLIYSAHRAHDTFSRTPEGMKLLELPRYGRFVPPIDGFTVTHWENLVGPDANNLRHMRRSISDARDFVAQENELRPGTFSPSETVILTRAAAIHDQAEAIHGDTAYGKKTTSDREAEAMTLLDHVDVFSQGMSEGSITISREAAMVAFGSVDEKLPAAFKTIELIGFMKNTLDCLQRLRQLNDPPLSEKRKIAYGINSEKDRAAVIEALERLTTEVLGSGVVGKLIAFGERFPSAHMYLIENAGAITAGMDNVREETFDWYESGEDPSAGPDEKAHRIDKFYDEHENWDQWIEQQKQLRSLATRTLGSTAMLR